MTPTLALAEQALAVEFGKIPAPVLRVAKQALLDWFACTIAGANEPLVNALAGEAIADSAPGPVPLVGRRERLGRRDAAYVNGAASHALDYDDVNVAYTGHPTVTVVPALLAWGCGRDLTGRDFLAAYIAGYETLVRVGVLAGHAMYNHGFHATGVCGVFGAAAAVGRLVGLDASGLARAFGIAGTQAAGLKASFGTMCKPLHAGMAARNGMEAALLAARGFTGREDILECAQGFVLTHSPQPALDGRAALGPAPSGWHTRDTLFKYHAACYMTHAPIECGRAVRVQAGPLTAATVKSARLVVMTDADRMCNIAQPRSGLEAKFSLRQTVAMALAGVDTAGLDNYSAECAADPALAALRERFTVALRSDVTATFASLEVETTDGRRFAASHDAGIPARDLDEQEERLRAKFDALVTPRLGRERSGALAGRILALESAASIDPLLELSAR